MRSLVRSTAARIIAWVPNLFVLALLFAIGWWGHHYHWTIPTTSAGQHSADEKDTALEVNSRALDSPGLIQHLPAIEFPSVDAATNCGIVTTVARRQAMNEVVVASGTVGYDQTSIAQLSARVPGVVWRVERRLGDFVHRGDVLVIIDSAEVGAAKAALLEAAVVYRLKTETRRRLAEAQNAIAVRSMREAEAAEDVARAQRFNALQRLLNLGFSLRLSEIDGLSSDAIAERLHLLGLPESLDAATPSANLIPMVAPFTGVITHCDVVQGEIVDPSKSHYVIADTSHMWINLDIRHEDCANVRLGATVVFRSDGGPAPVSGTLTWIGTEINPRTRAVQARAEVKNPLLDDASHERPASRLLQANAFGDADIVVSINPDTVVVPSGALHWQWELGRDIVFVPSEGGRRFEPRLVRKGLARDDYVQVLDGLTAGEPVVTSGSRILLSELSERLQERWGDNNSAVRGFGMGATAVE
jgi:cobalt-zinc-cadmium efflux system membrane fusion protein